MDGPMRSSTVRVPARVGLAGNPSDGFGGAVLAVPFDAFTATVSAAPSAGVQLGEHHWRDPPAWRAHVARHGHGDERRIVSAALHVVAEHLGERGGVELRWATTIPSSVGLAGSSALAVATVEAVAAAWGTSLDPRVVAALALRAEVDELGIAAGWQDRIVQSFRTPVLVDVSSPDQVDGVVVPTVVEVRPGAPVRLVVGWSAATASGSDDYHRSLRRPGAVDGEAMRSLAELARSAAAAMAANDVPALAHAVAQGWAARQAAAPLRDDHAALVHSVRRIGVAATTPGSGGAVVCVPTNPDEERRAWGALLGAGCTVVVHEVRPAAAEPRRGFVDPARPVP